MEGKKSLEVAKEVSMNDALVYIRAKKIETISTGRIDSEPSDFDSIGKKLEDGIITPKEAIIQVDALIAARQDYN